MRIFRLPETVIYLLSFLQRQSVVVVTSCESEFFSRLPVLLSCLSDRSGRRVIVACVKKKGVIKEEGKTSWTILPWNETVIEAVVDSSSKRKEKKGRRLASVSMVFENAENSLMNIGRLK